MCDNVLYCTGQSQGPSSSAYVTYLRSEDALRAIQAVNNIFIDGRTLKASLGTTKYCSHFMKNQTCPKNDCMYLHELGDDLASFTKEQMQQGKHTEYEKALHEEMLAGLAAGAPPSPSPDLVQLECGEGEAGRGGAQQPGWDSQWRQGGPAGADTEHWGGRAAPEQAWPDLGPSLPNYKGRFINSNSKEENDKSSKSKSSSSSDCDSSSLPGGLLAEEGSRSTAGQADAAWEGSGVHQAATPPSEPSSSEAEQPQLEKEHQQLPPPPARETTASWLDDTRASSLAFLDDDDDDALGK